MLTSDTRTRILDLFGVLRRASEDGCMRFANTDWGVDHTQRQIPYGPLSHLKSYARCRAWSLRFQREGRRREARREAAKAGAEARRIRAL